MSAELKLPAGIHSRIRFYVIRRGAIRILSWLLLTLSCMGLVVLVELCLDHLFMLPAFCRRAMLFLFWLLPLFFGLSGLFLGLKRFKASASDLRRLDNASDDMRAAMNLSARLNRGDRGLNGGLVQQSVDRAEAMLLSPLPSPRPELQRLGLCLAALALAAIGLLGCRLFASDLHTCLCRWFEPGKDFGSVGARKFQVRAELREHPAVAQPMQNGASEPGKLAEVYFLRERLEQGSWQKNFQSIPFNLADRLAGYNPLAVHNRQVAILEGDKLILHFSAVDHRRRETIEDVDLLRLENKRAIARRYRRSGKDGKRGFSVLNRVRRNHEFIFRSGRHFSPRYRVQVIPRPSPDLIYLIRRQPAQYGKGVRELVVLDRQRDINLRRFSGLPGTRMSIEFLTPYGLDLDPRKSHVLIGKDKQLKLRYATSRDPSRRAGGLKFWTFDFILDESIGQDDKLSFHLVTKEAQFRGKTITNKYDEPFLVQKLDDLPPTVEITRLPQKLHFPADGVFAIRYRYADDFGIAEISLATQPGPQSLRAEIKYAPLHVRPPTKQGTVRREDELTAIIDLKPYRHGALNFWVVVKDVKGQAAQSSPVRATRSSNQTERLLPRLSGGWFWSWSHATHSFTFRPGDLEAPPAARDFPKFVAGLRELLTVMAGKDLEPKRLKKLAGALKYRHGRFLNNAQQPFAFHHRDYPYYFQRQGSTWLSSLAAFNGETVYAGIRGLLGKMAQGKVPADTAEFAELRTYRGFVSGQFELAEQLLAMKRELSLRVALLRAAHYAETLSAGLARVNEDLARLKRAAGRLPAEKQGDEWQVYPEWVIRNNPKRYNLQQEARLIQLKIRNLNARLAILNKETAHILATGKDLDSRLMAVTNIIKSFGRSVYEIDRDELARQSALLARFIRHGILAAEKDVYAQISGQFRACKRAASESGRLIPKVHAVNERWRRVRKDVQAIMAAELAADPGEPKSARQHSTRWKENQKSRMRDRLELIEQHAWRLLYDSSFQNFDDLNKVRHELNLFKINLQRLQAELGNWPALAKRQGLMHETVQGVVSLLKALDAAAGLERNLGILTGFTEVFRDGGLPELKDRELVRELHKLLASLASYRGYAEYLRQNSAPTEARRERLTQSLAGVSRSFDRLAKLPVWKKRERVPAERPHPAISEASSVVFDQMAPDTVLKRLDRDLQALANHPNMADALFETVTRYFTYLPTDTHKDAAANPVEEYLRARAGAALLVCSEEIMREVIETYVHSGNDKKQRVLGYFDNRYHVLTPEVKAWIARQDYRVPAIPAPAQELLKPYLDAYRAGKLKAHLRGLRQQRLTELLELTARTRRLSQNREALVRAHALRGTIDELVESVRLLRYEADDLRVGELWAAAREQAEGLERDLLAKRLPAVPDRTVSYLRQRVHVFREPSYGVVLAAPGLARHLQEYLAELSRLEQALIPRITDAASALREDSKIMQRDLILCIFSTYPTHLWFRRKLEAEHQLKKQELAGLTGTAKVEAKLHFGSMHDGTIIQERMNQVAYAWRSICNLKALDFAVKPNGGGSHSRAAAALQHDYSILVALTMLPEYYYDNFKCTIARRMYASKRSGDALVERMMKRLNEGWDILTEIMAYCKEPVRSGLPTKNESRMAMLKKLAVETVAFEQEKIFAAYQNLYAAIMQSESPAKWRQAVRRIRESRNSYGFFWRELGRHLADFFEAGSELADAERFALLPVLSVRERLAEQQAYLQGANEFLKAFGGSLSEAERKELAVMTEAREFSGRWLSAYVRDPKSAAELQPAYRDVHEAVGSFLKSIQGSLFPPDPKFPFRPRYRHAFFSLGQWDFQDELLATEARWYARSDYAQALLYREFLRQARRRVERQKASSLALAFAFERFMDARFRYLMPFASPRTVSSRPPPKFRYVDESMPEHLGRAFSHALSIDLPEQDNRLVRELYFEMLQEEKLNREGRD